MEQVRYKDNILTKTCGVAPILDHDKGFFCVPEKDYALDAPDNVPKGSVVKVMCGSFPKAREVIVPGVAFRFNIFE